jgi:hypothetical protein
MTLSQEIGDFGALVGLLLTLAALLTANRASALAALNKASDVKRKDKQREIALDALLAIVTLLLWLGGLPLAIRAARHLDPLAHGGPLLSVFVLSWVLLLGLVGWQVQLMRSVRALSTSD